MAKYEVTATVTVDVKIEIEAGDAESARAIFDNSIMLNAGLADVDESDYTVIDDCISEIGEIEVEEVD